MAEMLKIKQIHIQTEKDRETLRPTITPTLNCVRMTALINSTLATRRRNNKTKAPTRTNNKTHRRGSRAKKKIY